MAAKGTPASSNGDYLLGKCNGVIEIERTSFSSSLTFKIKGGEFRDKFGNIVIVCKNKDEKRRATCGAEFSDVGFLLEK